MTLASMRRGVVIRHRLVMDDGLGVCQNQNFIAEKTLDIDISLALLIYKLEG